MGKTLLDIQQVLPLPESTEYQIRLRRKAAEERAAGSGPDWTRYDLKVGPMELENLSKRQLFLEVVRALVGAGKSISELQSILPPAKFVGVAGRQNQAEFRTAATHMTTSTGAAYDLRRYYMNDADLLFSDGQTWALSNQWSKDDFPKLQRLIAKYPEVPIEYSSVDLG